MPAVALQRDQGGEANGQRTNEADLEGPQQVLPGGPQEQDDGGRDEAKEPAGALAVAAVAVAAPAEEVRARINDAVGIVEGVDEQTCVLVTGADSIEILAVYVGMLGLDFSVDSPPELVDHVRLLGHRYAAAAGSGDLHAGDEPDRRDDVQHDRRDVHQVG